MARSRNRRDRPRSGRARRGASPAPRSPARADQSRRQFGLRPKTMKKVRRWAFIGVASLFALMIIGSFALSAFPGSGGGGGGRTSLAEGVGESVPIEGASHVPVGELVSYDTVPPTSGNHWGVPADCGVYDREVDDEQVVHNMEHGHVIISHNLLGQPEELARFEALVADLPDLGVWGIVRPYDRIEPGTVAMTAWGVIDTVQGVDEERIKTFYDAYMRNRFSSETARLGAIPCASSV